MYNDENSTIFASEVSEQNKTQKWIEEEGFSHKNNVVRPERSLQEHTKQESCEIMVKVIPLSSLFHTQRHLFLSLCLQLYSFRFGSLCATKIKDGNDLTHTVIFFFLLSF